MRAVPEFVFTMQELRKVVPPERVILDDITLAFLPGAKIGVIGGNGAGKSSLLRIMAGIDTDFHGEAWAAKGTRVGYLPQEPELDPSLDVKGNVELAVAPIRALLEKQVEQMLAELPEGNRLLRDVSEAIAQSLHDGHTDASVVARKLGMSDRTLRRRLAETGASFQKLVDDTRFTLAKRFLRASDMDATEIAFELGYNNLSTFGRAFRRWSGMSPVEFRRSQR